MPDQLIRNICDTVLWVAVYRAMESERAGAVFRDPFARRLAGERGEEIMRSIKPSARYARSYTARTHLIDTFVQQEVERGADIVIDLAAGLDARPYRMPLPPSYYAGSRSICRTFSSTRPGTHTAQAGALRRGRRG